MPPIIFPLDRFVPKGLPSIIATTTMLTAQQFQISGVTRDSSGARLGNCNITVFRTRDDVLMGTGLSDALGNYQFVLGLSQNDTYYVVADLPGSPAVAGVTNNTIVPV